MAARIFAIDEVSLGFRNHLLKSLRGLDEAVMLPLSDRNETTGVVKNVVFRLSGSEPNAPLDVFNPNWFTGVSAVKIESPHLEAMLKDPVKRKAALQKLRDAIPSEMADEEVQVGPGLDCDETDCDQAPWTAGFDTPGCFVGLFSAEHSAAPEVGRRGMNRVHSRIYLVCKAGAGLAGATFQSRLSAALRRGKSLDEALETSGGEPGPAALRRVSMAGSRNRARILMAAGTALGVPMLDTVPDQSSKGKYRCAVTHVDVQVNTLRKVEDSARSVWQYTTAVDTTVSQGIATMSNIADGLLLMLSSSGDVRVPLRNDETHSAVPFSSARILQDRDAVAMVTKEHKDAVRHSDTAHPDHEFVHERFVWRNRKFKNVEEHEVEPLALWGTYDSEGWVSRFAREMGVDQCQMVWLRPNLVCLAGMEPSKLRAALKSIQGAS